MTALAPPPPGFPLRDGNTGTIWQQDIDNGWTGRAPNGRLFFATWDDIAGGKFGTLEMLVPVPYTADTPDPGTDTARQALIAGVLEPVAAMMQQLAEAAGAGLLAVMADVYQQGRDTAGDQAEIRVWGQEKPVGRVPLTVIRDDETPEHGPAGTPEWDPDVGGGIGGYVAACLCGESFAERTSDRAGETLRDHVAAVETATR